MLSMDDAAEDAGKDSPQVTGNADAHEDHDEDEEQQQKDKKRF